MVLNVGFHLLAKLLAILPEKWVGKARMAEAQPAPAGTGRILAYSWRYRLVMILFATLGLYGVLVLIVEWLAGQLTLPSLAALSVLVLGVPLAFLSEAFGRKIILHEHGLTIHRPLRPSTYLAWNQIDAFSYDSFLGGFRLHRVGGGTFWISPSLSGLASLRAYLERCVPRMHSSSALADLPIVSNPPSREGHSSTPSPWATVIPASGNRVMASASENEHRDAEQVDRALAAVAAGDLAAAEGLLLGVIANTPAEYVNSSEDPDGTLIIKFWDQQAFIHYVMWETQQGSRRNVRWISNAYPRAHYHMGFLCVEARRYDRALEYLRRGQELEPTNPKFNIEIAQALAHSGERDEALALYEAVTEIGPYVSALELAMARRGRGFNLIELGRLDEAEEAYLSSLEIEPGNSIAVNELKYIKHLRTGGGIAAGRITATRAPDPFRCLLCGGTSTSGVVVTVKGIPGTVCDKCQRKQTKHWWQFWN
jgi:hypothetical protein